MVVDHIRSDVIVLFDPESSDGLTHMPSLNIVVAH